MESAEQVVSKLTSIDNVIKDYKSKIKELEATVKELDKQQKELQKSEALFKQIEFKVIVRYNPTLKRLCLGKDFYQTESNILNLAKEAMEDMLEIQYYSDEFIKVETL